ncbi:MAG: response regulator transcription factor [Clostridiales bacterium]|nr:response regulator transcription factor [Clostridiales bacterium]
MSRILVVEDERKIARFLELELTHEGYEVMTAGDGRTGLEMAEKNAPDLMILDLMLPELSGIEVCRRLRHSSDLPIIMLTAKDDVSDKVMGLDMGADDYMTKPFAIEELLARIRVALRKPRMPGSDSREQICRAGQLTVNPARYEVRFGEEPVQLTKKEFDLLLYLMTHRGKAVTRDELLENIWGYEYTGDTNVVDVYVRYLRHKIEDRFGVRMIQTIRSVGYMFSDE